MARIKLTHGGHKSCEPVVETGSLKQFAEKEINTLDSKGHKCTDSGLYKQYFIFILKSRLKRKLSISYRCALMISNLYVHQIWIPKREQDSLN